MNRVRVWLIRALAGKSSVVLNAEVHGWMRCRGVLVVAGTVICPVRVSVGRDVG